MYHKATISGQICTGKTTLFRSLEKNLGWPTFSASQFFRDRAQTIHVSLQKAEEQSADITQEIDLHMQSMLKRQDDLLLEGWMAGIMADSIPGVLKILLTCDEDVRVQRFADREKLSVKDAQDRVREREKSWSNKLEKIYKRTDFWDPKNYDIVVDTTMLTPSQVLHTVLLTLGGEKNSLSG